MKKIIAVIAALTMLLPLASCGGADVDPSVIFTPVESGTDTENGANADTSLLFEKTVGSASVKFYGTPGEIDKIEAGSSTFDVAAKSSDAEFGFFAKDVNFDGKEDFAVSSGKVGGVTNYLIFLDNGDGGFTNAGEFGDPLFDRANSKIYATKAGTPETFEIYAVNGGSLTLEKGGIPLDATPEFKSDLSSYEQYMAPDDRDGYLLLVNSDHPLDSSFVPEDLTDLKDTRSDRAAQQLTKTAAYALEALYIEMRAAGYTDVSVTSGYRSYARQEEVFNMYLNMNLANGYDYDTAYAMVASDTALPGQSEHQSGLGCDMHNLSSASQAFKDQPVYSWLIENCHKFGFILRFPADKEDITKITFEPWHYRFVGRYHATKIHAAGLCLEEYIELLK